MFTRQMRGALKMEAHGQKIPLWMLFCHSLDALNFKPGRNNKMRPSLIEIMWASATDAGNRSMKKHGRQAWNEEDWNTAAACLNELCRNYKGPQAQGGVK